MVNVRAVRVVGQVLRASIERAAVTRQGIEVAGDATGSTGQPVRAVRFVGQVLGEVPTPVAVTRQGIEIAGDGNTLTNQAVYATRLTGEVLAKNPSIVSVTRQGFEVAGDASTLSTQPVLATRLTAQALSRVLALPTDSPPLPDNLDFFVHNWASAVEMSTSYSTDITTSATTAAEERRALVPRPMRHLKVRWSHNQIEEIDRVLVFLRRMTEERMAIPLYQDCSPLLEDVAATDTQIFFDTTIGRFSSGGQVIIALINNDFQFSGRLFYRIITFIQSNYITIDAPLDEDIFVGEEGNNWVLIPIIHLEQMLVPPKTVFKNSVLTDIELEVDEVLGPGALPPWSADIPPGVLDFRGYPIWNGELDWSDDLESGYDHAGEETDIGRYKSIYTVGDRPRYTLNVQLAGDRDLGVRTIKFLDSRRGRTRPWWQIDQECLWEVLAIQATGDFIDVLPLGNFDDFADRFSFVGLVMEDGTRYVREVVSTVDQITNWRITVTPQLPINLSAADVVHVARARLVRNESDSFEEHWDSSGTFTMEFDTIEVLDEGGVEL